MLIKGDVPISLSEEQIVDCWAKDFDPIVVNSVNSLKLHNWTDADNGGSASLAFRYLLNFGGQQSQRSYLYRKSDSAKFEEKCFSDKSLVTVVVTNWGGFVDPPSNYFLKKVLYNKGPVDINIFLNFEIRLQTN